MDLLFGSSTGLRTDQAVQIGARTAADGYGTSAAVDRYYRGDALVTDLWVGAPGRTVGGKPQAGAVDHYTLSTAGQATFVQTITEATPAVQAVVQAGARFGAVLSATNSTAGGGGAKDATVVVGAPGQTVDGKHDAGAATWLATNPAGTVTSSVTINRDSRGVSGVATVGDRFGSVVTAYMIGAPHATVNGHANAGLVVVCGVNSDGALTVTSTVTQNTAGVPGHAATGNEFGASLSADEEFYGGEGGRWIGVPGLTVHGRANAGAVIQQSDVANDQGQFSTVYTLLTQGAAGGLGGTLNAGNREGAAVDNLGDYLITAAPGTAVTGHAAAGVVTLAEPTYLETPPVTSEYSSDPITGMRYGTVLTNDITPAF